MTAHADRNLLFGLLALQNGMIDQSALVAAFHAWTRDKARPMAELLLGQGAIDDADRAALEAMVVRHLKRHGEDVEKSLAAVPVPRPLITSLAGIGDPDVDVTLGHVAGSGPGSSPTERDVNADATATMSVGISSGDGQRFRVLRPHARGGLGAVFVALDAELNREVALKQILDRHADDPFSRARFVLEAEITGGLEHPGIVPVYGLGSYGGGRPYYAMRFIRGDSLKEAIDRFHADGALKDDPGRRSLERRKLLRRFVDVCNAIDYAHSRGVIHRDIKPANIIVGKHGETLVVDWGLAKATGKSEPGAGERTLLPSSSGGSSETLPGSALGTPAYMSPEQARGELDRLGPRSDVYSLGATLYCLLAGKPPLEGDDVGELLRRAERGEFRHPRLLDPSIDKALEAVCLKAMATEPGDRYPSCRALADDVERWSADEPVSAWREPLAGRARRWGRRNRPLVTAASAAVLVAIVGLSAVLAVQSRANAALDAKNRALTAANARETEANAALRESNRQKDQANAALAEANARVQARFELARDAIRAFQSGVTEDEMLKEDRLRPLRDKLLRSAVGFYEKLEKLLQGQSDRPSRAVLAESYAEVGRLIERIGIQTEALAAYRKAVTIRRDLASGPGADDSARLELARALLAVGPLSSATGDGTGALAAYREALDLSTPLASGSRAIESAREALARSHAGLGSRRAAQTVWEGLVRDFPAVAEYRRQLAYSQIDYGKYYMEDGPRSEYVASSRRALAILEELARENPDVTTYQSDMVRVLSDIGSSLGRGGERSEAVASFQRARTLQEGLARQHPAVTSYRISLGVICLNLAHLLLDAGRPDEALVENERARAIFEDLVGANPTVIRYRIFLTVALLNIGDVRTSLGRIAEARESYARAVALNDAPGQARSTGLYLQSMVMLGLERLALAKRLGGDWAGAAADARRAATLFAELRTRSNDEWLHTACAHATLSALAGREGSGVPAEEATPQANRAMAAIRQAVALGYRDLAEYRRERALDPLRNRDDFRLLMMDLTMPADPFAK